MNNLIPKNIKQIICVSIPYREGKHIYVWIPPKLNKTIWEHIYRKFSVQLGMPIGCGFKLEILC
jgi:hypothetical protein